MMEAIFGTEGSCCGSNTVDGGDDKPEDAPAAEPVEEVPVEEDDGLLGLARKSSPSAAASEATGALFGALTSPVAALSKAAAPAAEPAAEPADEPPPAPDKEEASPGLL